MLKVPNLLHESVDYVWNRVQVFMIPYSYIFLQCHFCPTSQNSWKQSIVMISGFSDSLDPIISLPGERRRRAGGDRSSQHSLFWHYAEVRHHLWGELGWPSFIYCNSGLWPGELSGKQHLWKKDEQNWTSEACKTAPLGAACITAKLHFVQHSSDHFSFILATNLSWNAVALQYNLANMVKKFWK